MRSSLLYFSDLAGALEKIEEFTAGMTYDGFLYDDKTQSAVIRKFEVIGEAAKRSPCPSGRGTLPFHGRKWRGCGTN
ncbi:uncharacterized protein with HEPN domain [Methanofollis sp. W23]|uniref:HepT-like ribonuclease domain-containing protein n=1 Tax=Methanofollis sp. W23 TaxID=2817849 RepID=UPI001AE2C632|nr:HepT-like ribonuclease domain-containing protein [Methanofollis sp. W23]MBP2146466.1 uncharacterized protein with HEPN domain [Methanofollis sp. W23]